MSRNTSRRALLAGLAVSAACGPLPRAEASEPASPKAALWAGLALIDAQGRGFTLGQIGAPALLVQLWAHWCPVCWNEMGALAELERQHRDKVVLVSHPQWWERDRAMAQARGLPFTLATLDRANGRGVIDAALIAANGAYAVPRSIAMRLEGGRLAIRGEGIGARLATLGLPRRAG